MTSARRTSTDDPSRGLRKRIRAETAPRRRGYALLAGSLLAVFLLAFVVVESLGVPLLTDPSPQLAEPGITAAAVGAGLLAADVLLPVPASAVMVAHGALFGVAAGTALSLAGGLLATLLGFGIGRKSRTLVARLVTPEQRDRAERWLQRYGPGAIVLTRPVPMLAETTAIIAGTSPMRWRWAAAAGAAGHLVPALLYALTGAAAASFASQTVVFVLVLAIAAGFWLLGRRATTSGTGQAPPRGTTG